MLPDERKQWLSLQVLIDHARASYEWERQRAKRERLTIVLQVMICVLLAILVIR